MFKITNNNISITRGETATYDAVFKHSDGTPFVLDKNLVTDDKSVYGLFSVKLSMYDENAIFRVPMQLDELAVFDTSSDALMISDANGSFTDVNVPESSTINFEDSDEYRYIYGTTTQIQPDGADDIIFSTKNNTVTLYFKANDGFYRPTSLATAAWLKDTTLTNALPYNPASLGFVKALNWNNTTYFYGIFNVDNTNTPLIYVLDVNSNTPFQDITNSITGITPSMFVNGRFWDDDTNLYFNYNNITYIFDPTDYSFTEVSMNITADARYIWKDADNNVYLTTNVINYKWNKTSNTWVETTSNHPINPNVNKIYVMKGKTYYVTSNTDYILIDNTNGLIWEELPEKINTLSYVWNIGDEWYTTSRTLHRKGIVTFDDRKDKLYKFVTSTGVPTYYTYIGNTETIYEDDFKEYEFRLVFPFPYNIMKTLQPKLYKYEIAIVGGTMTGVLNGQEPIEELPMDIDFKQYLVEFKDFKVEGSLSE